MNNAVIINLDYEMGDSANCRRIWQEIETRMMQAGFVKSNRLFLTTLDQESACRQAKAVVAEVDTLLGMENINVFGSIREFYSFEYSHITDLLAPASPAIEVSFLDTGTFRAFLKSTPG